MKRVEIAMSDGVFGPSLFSRVGNEITQEGSEPPPAGHPSYLRRKPPKAKAETVRADWKRTERKVYQHRPKECFLCKSQERHLSCHHVIPRAEGGTDDWTNLLPLCEPCHDFIECHESKPRTVGAIIRLGLERIT